jgi:hypothetical protein
MPKKLGRILVGLMTIDSNLVTGISTALGAGIGGFITYLTSRRSEHINRITAENEKLTRDYKEACGEIEAFRKLEDAYYNTLAPLQGKTPRQTQLEMRQQVENTQGVRPSWSAREARREINRLTP